MTRVHHLFFAVLCATVGLLFGAVLFSAEASPTRAPQGNTIDCLPNRRTPVTTTINVVGRVWLESDAPDGIYSLGETRINTVTVRGRCTSPGNGKSDVVTTTPGADFGATGLFTIPIAAGAADDTRYSIEVDAPQGYYFTWQNMGQEESLDSDVSTRGTTVFTLPVSTIADANVRVDIGLTSVAPSAVLGGVAWQDANADGIRDDDEVLQPDIPFTLICPSILPRNQLQTATEESGLYSISLWYTGTSSESCQLSVTSPSDFELSPPNEGIDDTVDSDFDPITGAVTVTLGSQVAPPSLDAGLKRKGPPLAVGMQSQQAGSTVGMLLMGVVICSGLTGLAWRRFDS